MDSTVIGLIGIIIGWVLTETANLLRTRKSEKQQRRTIRTMIKVEVLNNLYILHNYESMIAGRSKTFITDENKNWSRDIWLSQLPLLGSAFNESEIFSLSIFYKDISKFQQSHSTRSEEILQTMNYGQQIQYDLTDLPSWREEFWDRIVSTITRKQTPGELVRQQMVAEYDALNNQKSEAESAKLNSTH